MNNNSISKAEVVEMQQKLTSFISVSGREQDLASFLLSEITKYTDKAWIDSLGNVLAIKQGISKSGKKILIDAHMDEVGFIVRHIDEKGFLHFSPLGGIDQRLYPGCRVLIQNSEGKTVSGIIGLPPPHITKSEERKKSLSYEQLFIDIGAEDKKQVKELGLDIGSTGVLDIPFEYIQALDIVRGRGFDDKTGCNVLLQVAKALDSVELPNTILFSFTVAEEVGGRGAKTAAYKLEPDIVIAIENTIAADLPDVPEAMCPTRINKGPAITIADRSIICDKRLIDLIKSTAKGSKIPYQYKKPTFGGTNAGAMHVIRKGIRAAVISVPCRYIHSPFGQLKLNDLINTIQLLTNVIQQIRE